MANNYLQPVNNYFDHNNSDFEDVDDDIFLSNSRSSTTRGVGGAAAKTNTNPFEDDDDAVPSGLTAQQLAYAEKKRQIEERTLNSTEKSLGLLYETEEVGKATAVELAKQREQLENTSRHLNEINTTLRFSQRHLTGLKSVFGSLKNYLSGNRETLPTQQPNQKPLDGSSVAESASSMAANTKVPLSPTERYDNHPVTRLRGDTGMQQQRMQQNSNPFETQLNANLEEMSDNLSRLKFLASDLGQEIESQNELLDNMNYKIEDVDIKMSKQNKEMNKLLGKK